MAAIAALLAMIGCHEGRQTAAGEPIDRPAPAQALAPAAPPTPSPSAVPELPPLPELPILTDEIRACREIAQRRLLRDEEPLQPELPPLPDGPLPGAEQPQPPEGLPGFFAPLEIESGARPLASFERALSELEAGARAAPVRVALYGGSGVAADRWTGYLRAYLQARFGDGGPGIVPAAPPHRWTHHQEMLLEGSSHWARQNAFKLADQDPPGPFGVMGQAVSTADPQAWATLRPRERSPSAKSLSFYEIHFLRRDGGGSFELSLDGRPLTTISTALELAPDHERLGKHRVALEPGQLHELRIDVRGDGEVWLLGVVAETGAPGIVLDTLGANGGKTANILRWDSGLWAGHLRERDPTLYVLAYGNNSSVDVDIPISDYEAEYQAVLERFRDALPDASCVMVGPSDYPIVERRELRPRPRLTEINHIQRELAPAYGCAFLNSMAVYGGEGSKQAWVEAGLAKDDYLHLRRLGYLRFGLAAADALLQPYDWRARLGLEPGSEHASRAVQ